MHSGHMTATTGWVPEDDFAARLSDGAKRRAASGAFSKHIGEMMGRAFSEAFTDSFGATTP